MLFVDFESRGVVELGGSKSVGTYNYARHPLTEPLMLSWAPSWEAPVELWQMRLGPMPLLLKDKLEDPNEDIVSHHSTFERYLFDFKLGIKIPIERFQDTQPSARYLSLPGDLASISEILGLPIQYAKEKRGKALIELFCKPHKLKKKAKDEEVKWGFYDWDSHPTEWEEFCEYCKQDTVAEREVLRREKLLGVWPLPPNERRIWIFDQKVNDRGIPVDRQFVTNAYALASREKAEKIEENNKLTGLENSNSNTQLIAWAKEQGYDGRDADDPQKFSLEKDVVKSELKKNDKLTPLCRQVLENRQSASSTSYKKMAAILRQISEDDRVRNQFVYMGSSRCGRWAGAGLQFHNMARPIEMFEDEDTVNEARDMIYRMDYEGIKKRFIDSTTKKSVGVLLTVKSNVRTAFVVKEGKRFNVSDLNAIETRVGAWLAQCETLLKGFREIKDFDSYMYFAMALTQIPYEILIQDKKSDDPAIKATAKKNRQMGKVGVLGCIYRMSAATLLAYAEGMGIILTTEQAEQIVKVFREAYKEFVYAWFELEEKIEQVMKGTKVIRYFGPNDCIKIDKFVFDCQGTARTILRIHLPSNRKLHYMDASWESTLMPWKNKNTGEDVYRDALNYFAQDQQTKQWVKISTHGGKVFENVDQGFSRDILSAKLLRFEEAGLPVVFHVHDEGGAETDDDLFSPGLAEMNQIMAEPVDFAPGLPLGSDGFEGQYYHK